MLTSTRRLVPASTVRFALLWFTAISLAGTTGAQTLLQPLQVKNAAGQCLSLRQDICGDGIDQDCDGADALCPGSDADNDGFPAGQDCDDTAHFVFPGVTTTCSPGATQTCRADGLWSACTAAPLCEATAGGRCYYISPERGNDASPGTFDAPWRTVTNINYYYANVRPATSVTLQPGDVVYLLDGVYDEPSYRLDQADPPGNIKHLYLHGVHGTAAAPVTLKAYPGHRPRFTTHWTNSTAPVWIMASSHLVLDGLEVSEVGSGRAGGGVRVDESSDITLSRIYVHHIDGVDNDNLAGLRVQSTTRIRLSHSVIHDTYDRTAADTNGHWTENSRNVVLFRGGDIRITRSAFFQSPPRTAALTGNCISYKHGATDPGGFELDHNVFWGCAGSPFVSNTAASSVHHNLFLDSGPLVYWGASLASEPYRHELAFNTFVIPDDYLPGNDGALVWKPSEEVVAIGPVVFRRNIIADLRDRAAQEDAPISIGRGISGGLFDTVIGRGLLDFRENCYFAPRSPSFWGTTPRPVNQLVFDLYGDTTMGGLFTFAQWQARGYDAGSLVIDPALRPGSYAPEQPACAEAGWLAGAEPSPEPLPAELVVSTNAPAGGRVTGSGVDCPGDCTETLVAGRSAQLVATAKPGWRFDGWSGACAGQPTTCVFELTGRTLVEARFGNTPPTGLIVEPSGRTLSLTENVVIVATDREDPAAALTVEWRIDDGPWQPAFIDVVSGRHLATWNTGTSGNGTHLIAARVVDRAGAESVVRLAVDVWNSFSGTVHAFLAGDWDRDRVPDLVAIKGRNTGTRRTEVHILSGRSGFQQWILQTGTPLAEVDDSWTFLLADWDRDGIPDLICLKRWSTGSGTTEVHILSGASRFQRWVLQTGTLLGPTGPEWAFVSGDWNRDGTVDLVAVKQYHTASLTTEVHVLSGAHRFQRWILQTATPLHETDANFAFAMADWGGDRVPDLIAIKRQGTGAQTTQVHILSGAARFQAWLLNVATPLHLTDASFDFAVADYGADGVPDVMAIKKRGTGRSAQVHILSGGAWFQQWLLQVATPIPEIP